MARRPSEILGMRESQSLEFKRAEALKKPLSIARAIVSMLNAGEGGEIWIGVEELEGRATRLEGIEDITPAERRLWDYLVEALEPSPSTEVRLEQVPFEEGALLVASVERRPKAAPYAVRRDGGLYFWIRTGDRVRPMDRAELVESFTKTGAGVDPVQGALQALAESRDKARKDGMAWLMIRPAADQGLRIGREQIERWMDPTKTGNRRIGWTYARSFSEARRTGEDWEIRTGNGQLMTVAETGALEFRLPLSAFVHGDDDRELYPYAVLEYPVSITRLYRAMQAEMTHECRCVLGFAMFGLRGWKLRPFSPRAPDHRRSHPGHPHAPPFEEKELAFDLRVQWDSLKAPNDRVALQVVERIYHAFGYESEAIPREFDQDAALLRLAD